MNGTVEDELQRSSWRLALQTGALLVLLLLAIAASVLLIVNTSQAEAAQRLLATATDHVDSVQDAPAGTGLAIFNQGVLTVSPGMPSGLPDLNAIRDVAANGMTVQEDMSLGGRSYIVRTANSGSRVVQAVFDRHENLEELNRLELALLLTCGGAVVVASLLAVWLARRAMRPIAEALERVLEDLLVSADSRRVEQTEVDVAALADSLVQQFSVTAAHQGIVVERTGIPGPVMLTAAATELRRLFVALLDNAVRFARSRVDVDISTDVRTLVIAVGDDGPGFSAEIKQRAFERFTTAPAAGADPKHGSGPRHYGLGLALVAEVAAQHGGRVEIGARSPGAVIIVSLPKAAGNRGNFRGAPNVISKIRRMF